MKLQYILTVHILAMFATGNIATAQDVLIESRKEGKNYEQYSEPVGTWIDSNNPPTTAKSGAAGLTPQGEVGSRKFLLKEPPTGDSKTVLGSARFSPKIPSAGRYYIYATWPKAGNAGAIQYAIKHARGEDTVSVIQDGFGYSGMANANEWYLLGDYEFSAGGDQYVEARATGETKSVNPNPADIGQIFADAVRFSKQPLPEGQYVTGQGRSVVPSRPAAPTVSSPSAPAKTLEWLQAIDEGMRAAKRDNKKILVFFYSPEGNRSRRYEQTVFEDPSVRSVLQDKFVLVRINLLENPQLASQMRVFKAGTINIYDSQGDGIDQITDALNANELAAKLRTY